MAQLSAASSNRPADLTRTLGSAGASDGSKPAVGRPVYHVCAHALNSGQCARRTEPTTWAADEGARAGPSTARR